MQRRGAVAAVLAALPARGGAAGTGTAVYAGALPEALLASVEQEAKSLIAAVGEGVVSGGARSRTVWVPREQWEAPELAVEQAVGQLFRLTGQSFDGGPPAGAAVRARWLPVRWRPPLLPPDDAKLGTVAQPAAPGATAFPLRRSLLHFGGCSAMTIIAGAPLSADGELQAPPPAGAVVWPERGRYAHWPGRAASWAVADFRVQAFDGCVGKAELRAEHVTLQVDWWDRPVGNRTLNRLWALQAGLKGADPLPGGWEAPQAGVLTEHAATEGEDGAVTLTLPASRAAAETTSKYHSGGEDGGSFVHLTFPRLARNLSSADGHQGLAVSWGEGTALMGVPIISQAAALMGHIGATGARSLLILCEADELAGYAKDLLRIRSAWQAQGKDARVYTADAGRAHALLPVFGLTREDIPAAVAVVSGRYDPEADVAKVLGAQQRPDPRLDEVAARVVTDAPRGTDMRRDHPPHANPLTRAAWMAESRWVITKRDIDRLCRGRAAARASHGAGGRPTMCLFLFDRQREDDPGIDLHDKILDDALKSAAALQAGWSSGFEPIFVPTGAGGGGFGWPNGARDAAIRLGMGHRAPPFVAAWEPEWEKDGRWAAVYPPQPGYERKDWNTENIAQWLAELDVTAGTNPPSWWWSLLTNPATLIIGAIVICAVWAIVSAVLRSQYDASKAFKFD